MALITGATDGIGRASAIALARKGLEVLVHGRDPGKVRETVAEVEAAGGRGQGVVADLCRLDEVRALAAEVARRAPALHVLLANAGVYASARTVTPDGHETTFQVNFLAPFLLTRLLVPLLLRSAPARILLTSSTAHGQARLHLDDLDSERRWDPYMAYAESKLELILFARALARRLRGTGVTVNAFHPGVISTKLLHRGFGAGGAPVEVAVEAVLRLATAPQLSKTTGRYFDVTDDRRPSPQARDDHLAERLWHVADALTGLSETTAGEAGAPH
ncbi:SDR family NAD(P)-dependent oxidoreductase [Anaeromyxobacter paludicola]|uniref:SDR family NAD(P)-dependent oxidoreductase n=1 Tax=Anaeromyxobacter paludicola TaxID=2918171 RepID=UPI0020C090CF|nr:SDR family NAD(P)-dependent oxidoreductase [Anaeromyxobacter paludicola]